MEQELCNVCTKLSSFQDYSLEKWKDYIENDSSSMELLQHRLLKNILESGFDQINSTLLWLLDDKAALEQVTCSGPLEGAKWSEVLDILGQILGENSTPPSGYPLRVAIATALTFSWPVTSLAHRYLAKDDPSLTVFISGLERWRSFCSWAERGELFPVALELSTWHLRYVVGSLATDEELVWARENVLEEFKQPGKVGEAAHSMVKYITENEDGASVHNPREFYSGRPMTLAALHELGGVCGGVSKFGCAMSAAHGLPAMPLVQPQHCAYAWYKEGSFVLSNGITGWNKSGKHDGIQNTWGGEGEEGEGIWMIHIMQKAQQDFPQFCFSEKFRIAAGLVAEEGEKACSLLQEATSACWSNVWAWRERVDVEKRTTDPECAWKGKYWMMTAGKWLHEGRRRLLSHGKPVEVSQGEERAKNVVDGTRSEWMSGEKEAWLEIDLGEECVVEAVKIEWWIESNYSVLAALGKGDFVLRRTKADQIEAQKGWSQVPGWSENTRFLRLELKEGKPDPWNLGKNYGIRQILVLGYPSPKIEPLTIKTHRMNGLDEARTRILSHGKPVEVSEAEGRAKNVVDGTRSEWMSGEEEAWLEIDLGEECVVEAVKIEWWIESNYSVLAALGRGDFVLRRTKADQIEAQKGWSEVPGWSEKTRFLRFELKDGKPDPWNLGKNYGIRQILVLGYPTSENGELNVSTDDGWSSKGEKAWIEFNMDSVSTVKSVRVKGGGGKFRVSVELCMGCTEWMGEGSEEWKPLDKEFSEVGFDAVANKVRVEVVRDGDEEVVKLEGVEVVGVARGWKELMKADVEMEMGGEEATLRSRGEGERAALIKYVHGILDKDDIHLDVLGGDR